MGVLCDRLKFGSTSAVLAKTNADIAKKSSYCYSSPILLYLHFKKLAT